MNEKWKINMKWQRKEQEKVEKWNKNICTNY